MTPSSPPHSLLGDASSRASGSSVPWQDQSFFELIDTGAERRFDRLTGLVADILGTSICLVTLFDTQRAWIKSAVGTQLGCDRPHEAWICQPTLENGFHEVSRQGNEPFFDKVSQMLCQDGLAFYAGLAIRDSQGKTVGTLCILDQQ
nr:GAF domain-containing protein [Halomonas sp. 1513]